MICAAVYDKTEQNRKLLRDWIADYIMQKEMDIYILWFTKDISVDKLNAFAFKTQLAFVSTDDASGVAFGKMLYSLNPECRITYYSSKAFNISQLLCTRPVGLYFWNEGKKRFLTVLDTVIDEIKRSSDVLMCETRRALHLIPMAHIQYLQSDLKYVIIHTLDGDIRVYSKLSPLADKLSNEFVRIHKSYIVNSRFIKSVNKKDHTVMISNGEVLPISAVNYDSSLDKIRKLKSEI